MIEQFSEQLPFGEKEENEEEDIQAKQVIESLKTDPENQELLLGWLDKREREVAKTNTDEAVLQLNIEMAQVFRGAGLIEDAIDEFRKAAMQAWQQHKDDVFEELMQEAEKLARTNKN